MADLEYWQTMIVPYGIMDYRAPGPINKLSHNMHLQVDTPQHIIKETNIVVTLGPSTCDVDLLEQMLAEGMTIARLESAVLNDNALVDKYIVMVRQAAERYGQKVGQKYPVALALDTRGPEIRTGLIEGGENTFVVLKTGDSIKLTTDKAYMFKGNAATIYVDYDNIQKIVQPGNRIYLNDGQIILQCTGITGSTMVCNIITGGTLNGFSAVNLPGLPIDLPNVGDLDRADLIFAANRGVDIIFASFIRNAECIQEIRSILGEKGKYIHVVAKIENQQGIENLEEIIKVSDGAIVARGDLGNELPREKIFAVQKRMIALGRKYCKPIFIARDLLCSMRYNSTPTSAEVCDIANCVLEGIDGLQLSFETSRGLYPLESVAWMARICLEAENAMYRQMIFSDLVQQQEPPLDIVRVITIIATETANKCIAAAIFVVTTTGITTYLISKYCPRCPIVAITTTPQVARQSRLYRGVYPLVYSEPRLPEWHDEIEARIAYGITYGKGVGFIKSGDPVVVITPSDEGTGFVNTMRIIYVTDIVETVIY